MEMEGSGGRENGRLLIMGGARERLGWVMARPLFEQRDGGNAIPEGRMEEGRFGGQRESRIPL